MWLLQRQYRYTHTHKDTQLRSQTLSHIHSFTHKHTHSLTHALTSTLFLFMMEGGFGPMEGCKRQISSRPFKRNQSHQNRPNINEMAAFQSLATVRPRCGFFKGSIGTHKHKDTQLQRQALSHTHSTTHPPTHPLTH